MFVVRDPYIGSKIIDQLLDHFIVCQDNLSRERMMVIE